MARKEQKEIKAEVLMQGGGLKGKRNNQASEEELERPPASPRGAHLAFVPIGGEA